ncbi:hypothetical protein ACFL2R_03785 [Patescibacteria group bacterium]
MPTKIIEINLPEYNLESQPDYVSIGKKVDGEIVKNFSDGKYIYRAIGIDDHPEFSLDDFVEIVKESGTDKYDPERKEVCFDEFCMYDHDMQAGCFEIMDGRIDEEGLEYPTMFGDTVKKFYENVLLDRGHRVRIDALLLYDSSNLEKAKKIDESVESPRPELADCLYKFKDPENKKDALVGIIKILR